MTRRIAVLAVIAISQTAGLTVITIAVVAAGEPAPDTAFIPYAAAAGLAGVCGLAAFYSGLATGKMSVVAPISSMAVLVPVVVGLATGDRPSGLQAAGAALGIAGIVLASREATDEAETDRRVAAGVGLALLSGLGFGSFFALMDVAADHDPLWANLVNRGTSLSLAVLALAVFRPGFRGLGRPELPVLASIGARDDGERELCVRGDGGAPQPDLDHRVALPGRRGLPFLAALERASAARPEGGHCRGARRRCADRGRIAVHIRIA